MSFDAMFRRVMRKKQKKAAGGRPKKLRDVKDVLTELRRHAHVGEVDARPLNRMMHGRSVTGLWKRRYGG